MNSIDNLREYVLTASSICSTVKSILVGYIDGIKGDVAELADERDLLKRQWEAGVDFDQRLEACADKREDVTLFGVDYTPLPVDADGVPIHVGDVMEFSAFEVEKPVTRTVDGIGQGVFFAWCGERGYQQHEAKRYCHHHAPTVEDVLREFAHIGIRIAAKHGIKAGEIDFYADEDAIAEYAKKLRLAEGEDA